MKTRWSRGVRIAKEGDQIRRVNRATCMVKSQTMPGLTYTLTRTDRGWDCSCPDNVDFCKHVWALVHLAGDKGRAERGLAIYRAGQVQKVGKGSYRVKSQRSDFLYEVEMFSFGLGMFVPRPSGDTGRVQAHSGGPVRVRGAPRHWAAGRFPLQLRLRKSSRRAGGPAASRGCAASPAGSSLRTTSA